jgi:thiamine biosynthesis protein ThiS
LFTKRTAFFALPRALAALQMRADNNAMSMVEEKLRISVNGEAVEVPAGASVAALIAQLGLDVRKVAVERNLEIVPRSTYAKVLLSEADRIEIVHFIGGG